MQANGDAIISLVADFQDPPELIVDLVKKWEEGNDTVLAIKKNSKENRILFKLRNFFLKKVLHTKYLSNLFLNKGETIVKVKGRSKEYFSIAEEAFTKQSNNSENLPDIKTDSNENVALPPQLVAKWKAEGRLEQEEQELDDFFAKNLGAKDLTDLKVLVSKQINDEYKNSLDKLAKTQILKEIENFKVDEIPENLIEEEVKILSQGMTEEDSKKSRKNSYRLQKVCKYSRI